MHVAVPTARPPTLAVGYSGRTADWNLHGSCRSPARIGTVSLVDNRNVTHITRRAARFHAGFRARARLSDPAQPAWGPWTVAGLSRLALRSSNAHPHEVIARHPAELPWLPCANPPAAPHARRRRLLLADLPLHACDQQNSAEVASRHHRINGFCDTACCCVQVPAGKFAALVARPDWKAGLTVKQC